MQDSPPTGRGAEAYASTPLPGRVLPAITVGTNEERHLNTARQEAQAAGLKTNPRTQSTSVAVNVAPGQAQSPWSKSSGNKYCRKGVILQNVVVIAIAVVSRHHQPHPPQRGRRRHNPRGRRHRAVDPPHARRLGYNSRHEHLIAGRPFLRPKCTAADGWATTKRTGGEDDGGEAEEEEGVGEEEDGRRTTRRSTTRRVLQRKKRTTTRHMRRRRTMSKVEEYGEAEEIG